MKKSVFGQRAWTATLDQKSFETAIVHLDLVGEVEQQAQATRDQLAAIHEREAHELANMSQHARQLADGRYNYRDIAYLLGITYGRVGQILKAKPALPKYARQPQAAGVLRDAIHIAIGIAIPVAICSAMCFVSAGKRNGP